MAAVRDESQKAKIIALMGASGTGKTYCLKEMLSTQKPKRLLIIDPLDAFAEFATKVDTIGAIELETRKKSFKIRYVPKKHMPIEQMDAIARIAFETGNLWFVIEELNKYTKANMASPNWADCTLRGRQFGMTIIGLSQRPAGVDKDFFGNCSYVRSGRIISTGDARAIADVLGVKKEEITGLKEYEYIQRNMFTGEITRG
jgi:hypothetical protein